MQNGKYFEILEKVYRLTENTTPRSFDCGELCGEKCCGNLSKDEHQSGMALLPMEKEFLLSKGVDFAFEATSDGDMLICNGSCKRELRPFACRIFPYYVDITNSEIKIKKDPRAASVCPLLFSKKHKRPNIKFLRSIKKAARLMLTEQLFRDDLCETSDFIGYLYELYAKMEK